MAKQNNFPLAMNDIGKPSEMSPDKDMKTKESNSPFVEVNKPLGSQDPLEIRNSL